MGTLEAMTYLEKASKNRASLDIGQIAALEAIIANNKLVVGLTLDEVYFSGGNYDFLGIANVSLMLSNFSSSRLNKAKFSETKLEFSDLSNVDAQGITMLKMDMDFSIMKNANFSHSDIRDSSFNAVYGDNVNFSFSKLEKIRFTESRLKGANFSGTILKDVSFVFADLTEADFTDTVFENVEITAASMDIMNQLVIPRGLATGI